MTGVVAQVTFYSLKKKKNNKDSNLMVLFYVNSQEGIHCSGTSCFP